ncbi:MAG TPA: hypothetical protein VFO19_09320 [Vicinamibacterales bacterium]|nr:hypothetical protein [Vicinamibacterales bacterium]
MRDVRYPSLIVALIVAAGSLTAAWRPDEAPLVPLSVQEPQRQVIIDESLTSAESHPRVAIPDFTTSGDAELQAAAKVVADVLWDDLDFEREFYMIERAKTASIPIAATIDALPLQRWTEIGADYVIMASAIRQEKQFEVQLQLVRVRGVDQGQRRFGQKYSGCTFDNPRACAHYIADNIHKDVRLLDGVAQTKLAFVSDREGTRVVGRPIADAGAAKELFIADYDGFNARQVTANRSTVVGPSWSPDARTLAYTLWLPGRAPNVFVNSLDGRPVRALVNAQGDDHNSYPAWSPDGNKVAFSSNRSGNWDIWVVNKDGSGLRNLTPNTPQWIENAPTWSPDGNKIAFTSNRSGNNQIYVMNADGLAVDRLTSGAESDRPTWSSRNFIAYTSGPAFGHGIAIYDFTTGTPTMITDTVGDNGSPSVAPNGRHIAFFTTRWGKTQIATIDRRGERLRQITKTGNNTNPSWSQTRGR